MTRLSVVATDTTCPLCAGAATTSRGYRLGQLLWAVIMCQQCKDAQDALFTAGPERDRQAVIDWVTANRHRSWVTVVRATV